MRYAIMISSFNVMLVTLSPPPGTKRMYMPRASGAAGFIDATSNVRWASVCPIAAPVRHSSRPSRVRDMHSRISGKSGLLQVVGGDDAVVAAAREQDGRNADGVDALLDDGAVPANSCGDFGRFRQVGDCLPLFGGIAEIGAEG